MLSFIKKQLPCFLVTLVTLLVLTSCTAKSNHTDALTGQKSQYLSTQPSIVVGAEQIATYLPLLQNKRVGLVVNQTSMVRNTHLVDALIEEETLQSDRFYALLGIDPPSRSNSLGQLPAWT